MIRTIGIVAAFVMLAGGIATAVFALRSSRRATVARLSRVLAMDDEEALEERPPLAALWSELTRAAEGMGADSDLFTRTDQLLERAGLALRPAEYLVAVALSAVGGAILGATFLPVPPIPGLLVGLIIPPLVLVLLLRTRANGLRDRADAQLPDVLERLGTSMRSGYSLMQAVEAVGESAPAPLGPQLSRVVAETRVGRPLDEALTAMADRLGSVDLRWSVRAMLIQTRTGGSLADILEVLAEFMRDREEVRREVKVLTADGRISALVLISLPFVVFGALLALRPTYLAPLLEESLGRIMIVAAIASLSIGIVIIRKLVKVEV